MLAELGFQASDLLADGRLRDRDPLGRAGEVVLLGDGYEVGKLRNSIRKTYGNQTEPVLDLSLDRAYARPRPKEQETAMDLDASGGSASDSRRHSGPPRAKLALLTWAGAYVVVLVALAIGGPAMGGWPLALRALVLSGLMVAAMTWVIVPVVTRLFRGWLLR